MDTIPLTKQLIYLQHEVNVKSVLDSADRIKNKKGNPTDRTFVLLEKENNRVFCTYAPDSNRPPGKNFREIEHLFVEEIKNGVKRGNSLFFS